MNCVWVQRSTAGHFSQTLHSLPVQIFLLRYKGFFPPWLIMGQRQLLKRFILKRECFCSISHFTHTSEGGHKFKFMETFCSGFSFLTQ